MSKEREVSGKIISTDDACNWNLTVAALKDYDHVYVNGIRYTEYQPDINTQYLLDQVSRLTAENAMLKEKWLAQPETEQEPVAWMHEGVDETGETVRSIYQHFYEHANLIPLYTTPPKREPFGPEERQRISKAYSTRAEQVAFEEGIIFAKILYGIGGE